MPVKEQAVPESWGRGDPRLLGYIATVRANACTSMRESHSR